MLNILGLAKGNRPAQGTIAKRASDIQWHLREGDFYSYFDSTLVPFPVWNEVLTASSWRARTESQS